MRNSKWHIIIIIFAGAGGGGTSYSEGIASEAQKKLLAEKESIDDRREAAEIMCLEYADANIPVEELSW